MNQSEGITYRRFSIEDDGGMVRRTEPVPATGSPRWAADVSQSPHDWPQSARTQDPFFLDPTPFVIPPPPGAGEPFYSHNHCPAVTSCDNGDLLAVWFSTERESGTEMTILASRLRAGADKWDTASEFFKAPERNMTGSALFNDGSGRLYHFNGVGPEGVTGWERLALLMRTSSDNGVSWTPPSPISSGDQYQRRHQVIAGTSVTPDGVWIQPCDGTPGGQGPTAIHISRDGGRSWHDPGGDIRGIHAGVVGLNDGRLLAFGRAQAIDGHMPMSISQDLGASWSYRPSPFPPISSGQRLVLMRLREGPLLFVSFTDSTERIAEDKRRGMPFSHADGGTFTGYGMFAALSVDEGRSWPIRKLLNPPPGEYDGGAWTRTFPASATTAEPKGYLAATQSPDNTIHLISSRLHYRFNLAWIELPNGA